MSFEDFVSFEEAAPADGLLSDLGRGSTENGQQMSLFKHRRLAFMAQAAEALGSAARPHPPFRTPFAPLMLIVPRGFRASAGRVL